jgi:NAD(P)-dependent dehydrogenase (short-subunit alcohol dehydrogenase family)
MRLNGKVAPIAGAVSGIDHAIAKRLAEVGGRAVIVDLDPAKAARSLAVTF